ncbi:MULTISPECIES: IS481 family transposase [unclassified Curtobacterium]|uniref:IS481 family transposase n=2 Tax=unclassified Curtobacterium TaxID=257496 RepID=UPI0024E13F8A|nr:MULTISPECIES: IS481 family transposase [unclassified Curtobacterium]WIB64034.1 IS481 family transposase [Curtobacterium sp. MCBD17_040]WIB64612.1 IS481 family transposase [Curtobacterium sp. MCBD17_040]WIB65320.1 IS481 family transposase [Curtobacterium sp. MCBD17_040]WIE53156.1 IS481 family transposase [Curtobacterium sp. MCBD17_003]WIE54213.1 IS481 family transposase [Curtobacterium sp. MCBD17_003]
MSHANAALTPRQRLRIGRLIVDDGWPVRHAALFFHVSWPTAKRWADRYAAMGAEGMHDRSSRPHRSPNRTRPELVKKVVALRWRKRLGPVGIGGQLGMPASTVHAVLTRCRVNRLHHIDIRTGELVRRYEHERPGAMIHVDVKKLGNIPDGGGWRYVGRQQGGRNRSATPGKGRSKHRGPLIGTAFVHTVIDDHSRVAYAEIHDDEKAATAIGVLRRAVSWFAARGVRVERVLSDNGSAYKSHAWREACTELEITPKKTRPYRPQTNGKIERFHRTLADGWAFSRHYPTEHARRNALPAWLHHYNHHRPHTAIGNRSPITRLTNLPGQYT